ncbi:MAG: histidine phosphatase family protein [Candidatus Nitrosocosmicus sp.]|nr:histidine phosphatase family protein [Candidatus Nitrosocosmicus sp.]
MNDGRSNKILLILRHAKSSWKNKKLDDHGRPLNKRGRSEAIKMGKYLNKMSILPNLIITSSALRAIETTKYVCKHARYENLVEVNSSLYGSNMDNYISVISTAFKTEEKLLIVGHNPVLEELVSFIANKIITLPTCTLVQINLIFENRDSISLYDIFRSEIVNVWQPKDPIESNNL